MPGEEDAGAAEVPHSQTETLNRTLLMSFSAGFDNLPKHFFQNANNNDDDERGSLS